MYNARQHTGQDGKGAGTMRSIEIETMGANPEAFYDMCMASPEPVYIFEDGKPTLVAMSEELFDSIRATVAEVERVKPGLQ